MFTVKVGCLHSRVGLVRFDLGQSHSAAISGIEEERASGPALSGTPVGYSSFVKGTYHGCFICLKKERNGECIVLHIPVNARCSSMRLVHCTYMHLPYRTAGLQK
jgi:hypothetical protein